MAAAEPVRVRGLQEAIEQYGSPERRVYTYQVGKDTFLYWELVLRKRAGEVVIVLQRPNGHYLVHTKAFYPRGTYRLLTGGIKPGEDLLDALRREVAEETGLQVQVERFLGILEHRFQHRGRQLSFTSFVFLLRELGGSLQANDRKERISGFREVSLEGLLELADRLEALPPDWVEWGRFRASVHRFVVEVLSKG